MAIESKTKGRKRTSKKKARVLNKKTEEQNSEIMATEWQGSTKKQFIEHLSELSNDAAYQDLKVEQLALAYWLALPSIKRGTQEQFCEQWGITRPTLWAWSNIPAIKQLRFDMMRAFLIHHTPDVLDNLLKTAKMSALIGNPTPAIKLWLQYLEDYRETQRVETEGHVTIQFGFDKSKFVQPVDATLAKDAKTIPPATNAKK